MTRKSVGTRALIFGFALIVLALTNILFSVLTNTETDPFYLLITIVGLCLMVFGYWRRRTFKEPAD